MLPELSTLHLAEAAADGAPTDVSDDASSALPHGWLRGIDTSSEPSQTYYWDAVNGCAQWEVPWSDVVEWQSPRCDTAVDLG